MGTKIKNLLEDSISSKLQLKKTYKRKTALTIRTEEINRFGRNQLIDWPTRKCMENHICCRGRL